MKIFILKVLLSVTAVFLITSCMLNGKELNYPYPRVASVLKQKFKKYESEFGYIKPEIVEDPGYLYIYQQKCIDFYHTDNITIKLKAVDQNKSKISIKIHESNRRWNLDLESKEKSKEFLEALKTRLQTGKWPENPWDKFR